MEAKTEANGQRFKEYNEKMKKGFKEVQLSLQGDSPHTGKWEETFCNDEEFMEEFPRVYDNSDLPGMNDYSPDTYNPHIVMQTLLDQGGKIKNVCM